MSSVREKRSAVAKAQMQAIKKVEADAAKGIVAAVEPVVEVKTEAPKKRGRPKASTAKKTPAYSEAKRSTRSKSNAKRPKSTKRKVQSKKTRNGKVRHHKRSG